MNRYAAVVVTRSAAFVAVTMMILWGIYSLVAFPYIRWQSTKNVKYLYELVQQEELESFLEAVEEEEFDFDEENVQMIICDSDFRLVFSSDPSKGASFVHRRIMHQADKYMEQAEPEYLRRRVGEPIVIRGKKVTPNETYYVYIYSKMRNAELNIVFAQKVMAGMFLVLLCLYSCFMVVYMKWATKPLLQIKVILQRLKEGDFSARVSEKMPVNEMAEISEGVNEVGQLLHRKETYLENYKYMLNTQMEDVAEFDVMQKRLFAKVTHHLKTPLAIMTSQLELEFEEENPEKKKYYRNSILEEIEKMSCQISDLLASSKEDMQATKLKIRRTNLSELLQEMVPKYENWLSYRGIRLQTEIEKGVNVEIDPQQIEHAVNNYMMNAFSHTKRGKGISLRMFTDKGECVIEVYNEGDGIPEEDIVNIWESYYQRKERMVSDEMNVGLGLYIVKDIVGRHNGSCGVRNETDGVVFWIRL